MKRHLTIALAAALVLWLGKAGAEEVAQDLDTQLQALLQLGYDKPLAAQERMETLLRETRQAEQRAQVRLYQARLQVQTGHSDAASAQLDSLQQQFGSLPGVKERLLLLRAEIADRGGRGDEARVAAESAMDGFSGSCDTLESTAQLPRGCDFRSAWAALRLIERGHMARGSYALAEVSARQSLELAQAGRDAYMSAMSMGSLALIADRRDQADAARRWITLALQTAHGDALTLARIKSYEGTLAAWRGEPDAQLEALNAALKLSREADAPHLLAQIKANLADAYLRRGDAAQALSVAEQALPVLQRFGNLRTEMVVRHNIAIALIKLRQFDAARAQLARVEALRAAEQAPVTRLTELRELTEAWAAAGQPREALKVFHQERALTEQVHQRDREASLQQLKLKYDSERKQRDLTLLQRDKALKEQQLTNQSLAQQVGLAVAALLGLSLLLVVLMLRRVREANRRLKANQKLLRQLSERDPLTDLANRRHFLAVMGQHASEKFDGALLMVDIDHFKHVNDGYGHAAGDAVIVEVSRRISQTVRTEDLVVRWGGEELLVFVPGMAMAQLTHLAERILFAVGEAPVQTEAGALRVTVSIGFAYFPLPPSRLQLHWERAVNWADMVLYTAKSQGRNRAVGIATVEAKDAEALLQIEADFDAACSASRVQLCTVVGPQPKADPTPPEHGGGAG